MLLVVDAFIKKLYLVASIFCSFAIRSILCKIRRYIFAHYGNNTHRCFVKKVDNTTLK